MSFVGSHRVVSFYSDLIFNLENLFKFCFPRSSLIVYGFWKQDLLDAVFEVVVFVIDSFYYKFLGSFSVQADE